MTEPTTNAVVPAALPAPVPAFADRKFRQRLRDELRAEEWDMHKELIAVARAIVKNFHDDPHKSTAADLHRVMELASKLGRLATEPDCDLELGGDGAAVRIEFHAALKNVYARRQSEGRPLPSGVIIDAETVPAAPPAAEPSTLNPQPSTN